MLDLVRHFYSSEPTPITVGPSLVLRPLLFCLAFLSVILLLPMSLLLVAVPGLIPFAFAFVSYSRIYKSYYGNVLFYWLIVLLWIAMHYLLIRPAIWWAICTLMGW